MKKIAVSSLVLAMFGGVSSAFADVSLSSLTTKNYVDEGLKAVNKKAKDALNIIGTASTESAEGTGLIGDIESLDKDLTTLEGIVGKDANSGLRKQVADNAEAIQQLQNADSSYTAGDGIVIDAQKREISIKGSDAAVEGKQYVYKNGQLSELDIVSNWEQDGPNLD